MRKEFKKNQNEFHFLYFFSIIWYKVLRGNEIRLIVSCTMQQQRNKLDVTCTIYSKTTWQWNYEKEGTVILIPLHWPYILCKSKKQGYKNVNSMRYIKFYRRMREIRSLSGIKENAIHMGILRSLFVASITFYYNYLNYTNYYFYYFTILFLYSFLHEPCSQAWVMKGLYLCISRNLTQVTRG